MRKMRTKKRVLGTFVLLYSVLLVIGSTYAWVTMADQRVNRLETKRLEIHLSGQQQTEIVTPSLAVTKEIAVRNDGTSQAIVRVSLSEVLFSFEVDEEDQIGNGNLREGATATAHPIDLTDSSTWVVGESFKKETAVFLTGRERTDNQSIDWPLSSRPKPLQTSLELMMSKVMDQLPGQVEVSTPFWLYYNGHYYYSKPLKPGEWTVPLVESLQSTVDLENNQKGSLYELTAKGEAFSASRLAIKETPGWGLGSNNPVYDLLKDQVD